MMVKKENIGVLHLGKHLKEADILKNVLEIKCTGKNLVKITCKSWSSANNIINSAQLEKLYKYECFVPQGFVESEGIIFNVPLDFDAQEIMDGFATEDKVVKVERITKWNHEKKTLENTERLKITFRSFDLPKSVSIYRIPMRVYTYVRPPILCKKM